MALNIMMDHLEENGIEIKIIGEPVGKGLFAKKRFSEGDVIFKECPLVSCQFLWNEAYGYLACNYCMRPLETSEENVRRLSQDYTISLPYSKCCITNKDAIVKCEGCNVIYCSTECKINAWQQYHRTLCLDSCSNDDHHPLRLLQEAWKNIHYPPETASIMLLARIFATIKQAEDEESALALFMQFCNHTVNEEEEIAHKLLGEEYHAQLETLRELIGTALGGIKVAHWLTPSGFRSLMALVGTNGQGIGTSPFSHWVKNCDALKVNSAEREKLNKLIDNLYSRLDEVSGGFLDNEGSGLYSLQSTCNHSCVPKAMVTFPYNNFELVMIAMKNIEIGDEICISYLDECTLLRSRHSRIKILRENYMFTCNCQKCIDQANDSDVSSEGMNEEDECSLQSE